MLGGTPTRSREAVSEIVSEKEHREIGWIHSGSTQKNGMDTADTTTSISIIKWGYDPDDDVKRGESVRMICVAVPQRPPHNFILQIVRNSEIN